MSPHIEIALLTLTSLKCALFHILLLAPTLPLLFVNGLRLVLISIVLALKSLI